MKGFPKHLNTRQDYEYIRAHFPVEQWKPAFQALLDGVNDWFYVSDHSSSKGLVEDDTHKVVESQNDEGQTIYIQYEYRKNPAAQIFRVGYTERGVKNILKEAK